MSMSKTMLLSGAAAAMLGCASGAPERVGEPRGDHQGPLAGKTIAIVATDGVEQVELVRPREAFENAGATTVLIAPHDGEIQAFNHEKPGDKLKVDLTLAQAQPASYDGLFLPGGVRNPDALRQDAEAIAFVRSFVDRSKPIAAMCHGPWTLIEADGVKGRTVTSWPSLRTDLTNAGATWVDQQVVVDGNLVTSRKPDDIPAFVDRAIDDFAGKAQQAESAPTPAGMP